MNAGHELLACSIIFRAMAGVSVGRTRFLMSTLSVLAWMQAVDAYKQAGINLRYVKKEKV